MRYFGATTREQGIVHVVGPEQGFSLPGTTIVCGDSHTAAHGGVGALAFGIGTSEVEHVLATQTLLMRPSKTMEVRVEGELGPGITSKDLILHIIGTIGTAGGNGHVIEYRGKVFEADERRGPADGVQHEHRGRRPRRPDRARRRDVRLSQGPPARAQGRGMGPGGRLLAHAQTDRGRARSTSRW